MPVSHALCFCFGANLLPACCVFPRGCYGKWLVWARRGESEWVCMLVCMCTCSLKLESEKWTRWPTSRLKGQKTVELLCWVFSSPGFISLCIQLRMSVEPEHRENSCSHGVLSLPHKGRLAGPQLSFSHNANPYRLYPPSGGSWLSMSFTNLPESSPLDVVMWP